MPLSVCPSGYLDEETLKIDKKEVIIRCAVLQVDVTYSHIIQSDILVNMTSLSDVNY